MLMPEEGHNPAAMKKFVAEERHFESPMPLIWVFDG
jgi:hypothetical protein